jgi:hypothetical protein
MVKLDPYHQSGLLRMLVQKYLQHLRRLALCSEDVRAVVAGVMTPPPKIERLEKELSQQ